MKKMVLLAFLGCLLTTNLALAADEYAFVLKGRDNPYWVAFESGINEAVKVTQIKAVVYQTSNDRAAEEQLNVCLTAIQRKPKLLALAAVNPSVGLECLKKAVQAGIIVADMDSAISMDEAKNAGVSLAFSVGSDNFRIGQQAARYLSTAVNKPALKIFVLEGAVGSVVAQKRVDGFRSLLKQLMPASVVVASMSAEWDRIKALNMTTDLLQRTPDLDVIYAANDEMALGAVEAVRAAAKIAQIRIIGVDGIADARKAVIEGRMAASVAQLPYLVGKRSVELAVESMQSQKTNRVEIVPTLVLTKDLLTANKDPLLQYVR